jgi:hypothetical protein
MNKKSEINLLNKSYNKRFKAINNSFFDQPKTGIVAFIEYLKYIRDFIIINAEVSVSDNAAIATLITAVAEAEAYLGCNEALKQFHWNNFCELLKQNMEDWLLAYDSI